ncbi:hypothetical protein KRIGEM_02827 [Komagataeibacter rhaeticus]|nr:hypothetical protein KRIGEM_02827 [Komagataeibacter rhaeticus]
MILLNGAPGGIMPHGEGRQWGCCRQDLSPEPGCQQDVPATRSEGASYCWNARASMFCFSSDTGSVVLVRAIPCQPAPSAV